MSTKLPMALDQVAAAVHGSYCPKMCTFACPVAAATGLDEAVPWSFHREVSDLADGRGSPGDAWDRLRHCNGCLACQSACTYDQDVPAQVLEARAALVAAGHVPHDVATATAHLQAGRDATGAPLPPLPAGDADSLTTVVVDTDTSAAVLTALARLAGNANLGVRFVRGLGGARSWFLALGRPDLATASEAELALEIQESTRVVAVGVDLLEPLRRLAATGTTVIDVASWLQELLESGRLQRHSAAALGRVTWHDPVRLARVEGLINPPRQALRLLGGVIIDPQGAEAATVSAGPGLGMELLAPEAAADTARQRAAQLAATGVPVITLGSAVVSALTNAGLAVRDLIEVAAELTQPVRSPSAATPRDGDTQPDAPASTDER